MAILQIYHYFLFFFCNAKDSHILSTKNISVFAYEVVINLTSWGLKDDVSFEQMAPGFCSNIWVQIISLYA